MLLFPKLNIRKYAYKVVIILSDIVEVSSSPRLVPSNIPNRRKWLSYIKSYKGGRCNFLDEQQ